MLRDENSDSSGEDIIQEYKSLLATTVKKPEADLEERATTSRAIHSKPLRKSALDFAIAGSTQQKQKWNTSKSIVWRQPSAPP